MINDNNLIMLNVNHLEDLVCPIGKYPLIVSGDMLECTNCGSKFPVKEGIPMMLIEDAILPAGIKSIQDLKCVKDKNITV